MSQAVNFFQVNGLSPTGWSGGNPQSGDIAQTSDGKLWFCNNGGDDRNIASWTQIGTSQSGLQVGVDIQDEGILVKDNAQILNFIGTSISASTSGDTVNIDVSSSSGGDSYIFAGTFTSQNIIDNGVFLSSVSNVEPLYINGISFVRLDIIPLQANEVVTDVIISINQAFTYSAQGQMDAAEPSIYTRTYVGEGYSDAIYKLPIGTNPNAIGLQKFVGTKGVAPTYTYKANAPYTYSIFFNDNTNGSVDIRDVMTNASGSITVWYKKTTLSS